MNINNYHMECITCSFCHKMESIPAMLHEASNISRRAFFDNCDNNYEFPLLVVSRES